MSIIPKPKFPNIPKLPGVPQLLRSPLFPASAAKVLGSALSVGGLLKSLNAPIVWGVFDARGRLILKPDSVVDFGYRNPYQVSSFQVQRGAFASYNKVASGFDVMVRMTKGGKQSDRDAFLTAVEVLIADIGARDPKALPLYTVLTPEKSYRFTTLERYEMQRRGANGAFFLDVDLYFREIRQIEPNFGMDAVSTVNALDPEAKPPENDLRVQSEKTLNDLRAFRARNNIPDPPNFKP